MYKKFEIIPFVLGIIFLIISICFFVTGINTHNEYKVIKNDIIEIEAQITKITVLKDSDGMDSYSALVTYHYDGDTYENRTWKSSSNENKYHIGQVVDININPNDPSSPYNYDGNFGSFIFFDILFLAIGIGMIIFSFKMVNW